MRPDLPSSPSNDDAFYAAARPYWHPVVRAGDVAPGAAVGVTLLGEELVVFRSHDGELAVLDDLCSHRGARLSMGEVVGGCVRCPYHAWRFDGAGRCVAVPQAPGSPIPSRAHVASHRVVEHGSLVWVCLVDEGEERAPLPAFPESERADWHVYAGLPSTWACQATRQIENVLDIAHFSVIHTDAFGNPERLEMEPYTVDVDADGRVLRGHYLYPAREITFDDAAPLRESPIDFTYRVDLPFSVHLVAQGEMGPSVLFNVAQPLTADTCQVFWVSAAPDESALPDEMVEMGEAMVYRADKAVVEGVRPERLPLDLSSELLLAFDRFSIAYRRSLAGLGFPSSSTGPVVLDASSGGADPRP